MRDPNVVFSLRIRCWSVSREVLQPSLFVCAWISFLRLLIVTECVLIKNCPVAKDDIHCYYVYLFSDPTVSDFTYYLFLQYHHFKSTRLWTPQCQNVGIVFCNISRICDINFQNVSIKNWFIVEYGLRSIVRNTGVWLCVNKWQTGSA